MYICKFWLTISDDDNAYLKQRKPYVYMLLRKSDSCFKKEYIHLATLANNHLMDCNIEGLNRTIKQFEAENIYTIGLEILKKKKQRSLLYLTIMVKNIQYLMRIGIDVLCIENMIFMQ